MRNAYKTLVGKPEGKRTRHRWVNYIRMNFRKIGSEGVEWMHLAQDRDQCRLLVVNTIMKVRVT
jgi:hypothetical protein